MRYVVTAEFEIEPRHNAAFDAHLASAHFRAFDAATRGMIAARTVRLPHRSDPD